MIYHRKINTNMEGDKILTKTRFLEGVKFRGRKYYLNTFRYNAEQNSIELLVIYSTEKVFERIWIHYGTVTEISEIGVTFHTFIINKKQKVKLNFSDLLEKAHQ